jgi:hypothetical protein
MPLGTGSLRTSDAKLGEGAIVDVAAEIIAPSPESQLVCDRAVIGRAIRTGSEPSVRWKDIVVLSGVVQRARGRRRMIPGMGSLT